MNSEPQDLVILGGGTAGLVTAVGAAGVGARVTLVEADRTGGDCLWRGCVPSKALLSAARVVHAARTADRHGLGTAELHVDLGDVLDTVRAKQEAIAPHDSPERLERLGVTVLHGRAALAGRGLVQVDLDGGGSATLRTRRALLATGARPAMPPVDGLTDADPLTSDTVWGLRELPGRLVVLGGGAVGCELGQAFARLGSDVTIVEMLDRLVPQEEPEASAVLQEVLREEGVTVRVGTRAVQVDETPEGPVLVVTTTDDRRQTTRIPFDRVLVAAGRQPRTDDLGLEEHGVALRRSGHVWVDDTMRTSADWVLAAGDVTGELPFTHAAGAQGGLVVTNALFGLRRSFDASVVPWATFTEPEIGRIGMTAAEAAEQHGADAITVATFDNERLDRAVAASATHGFAKLVAGPRDRILGATVVSKRGGDVVGALTAWVTQGASLSDVGRTTLAYPTFAEAPQKAAGEVLRDRFLAPRTRTLTVPLLAIGRAVQRPWRS